MPQYVSRSLKPRDKGLIFLPTAPRFTKTGMTLTSEKGGVGQQVGMDRSAVISTMDWECFRNVPDLCPELGSAAIFA